MVQKDPWDHKETKASKEILEQKVHPDLTEDADLLVVRESPALRVKW